MSLAVLREVRLYGPLARQFGRSHQLAVDSPAEAIRALCSLFDGFREALAGHKGPGYRVLVGEGERTRARDEQTMHMGAGQAQVIRIAPVLHGAKRKGVLGVIVGVALMVAAPWVGLLLTGGAGGTSAAIAIAGYSATLGKALALGGVIQLLSPQRMGNDPDRETSYLFNGPVNLTQPGGPVPLIIGRMIVGSVTISAGLATDDIELSTNVGSGVNPGLPPGAAVDLVTGQGDSP